MVLIDPDVYDASDFGSSNETIVLSGAFPVADGVAALVRAGGRFMNVDENGVEHQDGFADAPVGADGEQLYTPNYVSDPEVLPEGIRMYVDCKGGIEPAMRQRFLDILVEELSPLGDDVIVSNVV